MEENSGRLPRSGEDDSPRPLWQIWAARVAVVLFIMIVIYQVLSILRGGQL